MNTSFSIKDCRLIDIPTFADERGVISVLDKELPFEVKRIFWLHHIYPNKDRGAHALLYGTEIMIALHGWFRTHSYVDEGVSLVLADQEYQRGRYTYDYKEYQYFRKI